MSFLIAIQLVGYLLAWLGSLLTGNVTPRDRCRGFVLYVIANAVLITWLSLSLGFANAWPAILSYLAFTFTAGRGLRNNLKEIRSTTRV